MAKVKKPLTDKQKISKLKSQLKDVMRAYSILEEYVCEVVGDTEDNETIIFCNTLVDMTMKEKL